MLKPDHHHLVVVAALLAIIVAAVYARALDNGFMLHWDDNGYVLDNPHIQNGLTPEVVRWAFTSAYFANWSPLTFISHALDVTVFGLKPAGHHAVNVLLHVVNTVLLLIVLARMTGALWRSALVAALFGLHPLHVESVAWISERKDVLSTMFWLLTMLAYGRFARRGGIVAYLLVALWLSLGLMAKSMLVTMPFVLLLMDYWPLKRLGLEHGKVSHDSGGGMIVGRVPLRRAILEKLPLLAICIAASVVTVVAQRQGEAIRDLATIPLWTRIGNAALAYIAYLQLTVWPSGLAAFYPMRQPLPFAGVIASLVLLVIISAYAVKRARTQPYLPVGWFWFLGTLVPVIGIVQVGAQSMADRYTYVPLIGVFIAAAWMIGDLAMRFPAYSAARNTIACMTGLACAALAVVTWNQIGHWRDSETLFRHALRVTSDNTVVRNILGGDYRAQGRLDEAFDQYQRSITLDPKNIPAINGAGSIRLMQDRMVEAVEWYRMAVDLEPDNAYSLLNLAGALALIGSLDEAQGHLAKSMQLDPDQPAAFVLQGQIHGARGKHSDAVSCYQTALRMKPGLPDAHVYAADALIRLGRTEEARSHLIEALSIEPNDAKAQSMLKSMGG